IVSPKPSCMWAGSGPARRSARRCGGGPRFRFGGQKQGRTGRLAEVECLAQTAEFRHLFPDVRTGVRAAVGRRVEPLAFKEIILDELQVRVVAKKLVVDEIGLRVRADDK